MLELRPGYSFLELLLHIVFIFLRDEKNKNLHKNIEYFFKKWSTIERPFFLIFYIKNMQQVIKPDHMIRDQLLQVMIDNEGSDMYITVGAYPSIKIS